MSALDQFRLDGRVAVVSGASSGLGLAIARALADAGADVALGARRADRLAAVATDIEGLGRRALAHPVDVVDPDACDAFVHAAVERFGRVDVLVNSAGIGTAVSARSETPEQFRHVIDTNLHGSYWLAQCCARVMQPGSSIINVSSVIAVKSGGLPQAAYSSSKAAILGLTRDLAQQWTPRLGIRVNALVPGWFVTDMLDECPPGFVDDLMTRVPMRRPGNPDELTGAAIYLASDASSYVTGTAVTVDGGALVV